MSAWEKKLKDLISPAESKWPYRIVQIKPNRKIDEEIYTISGREEDIAANGSLFLALYDLAQRDRINFEEWFAQWELGFPAHNQFREPGNSNYLLSGNNQWRVFDKRPKFRDWTPPEFKNKNPYRTIEYWPDRSNEAKSVVLSGTDLQLVQHIIQLEYTGKGTAASEETDKLIGGGEVKRRGKPQIHLYFQEDEVDIEPGYQPIQSKVSFRLMDQTDTTISKSELNQYRNKIESIFASQGGKIWRRGKDYAVYTDWENGYQLQLLVRSKAEGESLIKDLLAIQNITFHSEYFFYNENQNPSTAYPTNPGELIVLGKNVKKARRRPIANIRFQWASLHMVNLASPIYLVDLSGRKTVFTD